MRSCRRDRQDRAKRRLDEAALIEFVEVLGVGQFGRHITAVSIHGC